MAGRGGAWRGRLGTGSEQQEAGGRKMETKMSELEGGEERTVSQAASTLSGGAVHLRPAIRPQSLYPLASLSRLGPPVLGGVDIPFATGAGPAALPLE